MEGMRNQKKRLAVSLETTKGEKRKEGEKREERKGGQKESKKSTKHNKPER